MINIRCRGCYQLLKQVSDEEPVADFAEVYAGLPAKCPRCGRALDPARPELKVMAVEVRV